MKYSMLRSIIATITEIKTTQKCSNFSIVTKSLSIYKNTFLMVGKESANNLKTVVQKTQVKAYVYLL
mgnify:FL=1